MCLIKQAHHAITMQCDTKSTPITMQCDTKSTPITMQCDTKRTYITTSPINRYASV